MATNKPRLRAKAQPASNQDDGTKALERTRETGAYGSKEGWQVQIGASGKERQIARRINPFLMIRNAVSGRRGPVE
jgi:hypothetical protein